MFTLLPPQRLSLVSVRSEVASQRRLPMAVLVLCALGCGSSSPTLPTPQPPPPPANTTITGTVVNALTDQPVQGVTIRPTGLAEVTSTADGQFTLTYQGQVQFDVRPTTFSSPNTVERSLSLRLPLAGALRPSLIPTSFDLASFDAMFRSHSGVLRRWVIQPILVVERRVLSFTSFTDQAFRATAAITSAADAQSIVDDLSTAFPQLSGNAFPGFREVRIETSEEGAMVAATRIGVFVVARFEGLERLTGSAAWGQYYYYTASDEVIQGVIFLDPVAESTAPPFVTRANRMHVLGHAMAWWDVETVPSVMNEDVLNAPTEFDRLGSRLAFLRSPGNRTPDVDFAGATVQSHRADQPIAGRAAPGLRRKNGR